jgi:hypothetical protein
VAAAHHRALWPVGLFTHYPHTEIEKKCGVVYNADIPTNVSTRILGSLIRCPRTPCFLIFASVTIFISVAQVLSTPALAQESPETPPAETQTGADAGPSSDPDTTDQAEPQTDPAIDAGEALAEEQPTEEEPKDEEEEEEEEPDGLLDDETEVVDHYRNSFDSNRFAQVDESSGMLKYEIPLTIPPGRNGLQPDLRLIYESKQPNEGSLVGYGWSLSLPYIQRMNKRGLNNAFDDNYFFTYPHGELATTTASSTLYMPKI